MPEFPASQVQNNPVYSLPHLYISGLNISVASTTVLAVAPGMARDQNDFMDMTVSFPDLQGYTNPVILFSNYLQPIFINSAINGVNGLDIGTLAASTEYAIYLIADTRGLKQTAAILSLTSNAAPIVPLGYDSVRLLGFALTDASAHFIAANILNANFLKSFYLQPQISVLAGGNAIVFTAIDLSTAIPTTTSRDVIAYLNVTFIPQSIGDTVQFRPTGSTATTNLNTIAGIAAGVPQQQFLQVICGVGASKPEIDYRVSVAGDSVTVLVAGYSFTTS